MLVKAAVSEELNRKESPFYRSLIRLLLEGFGSLLHGSHRVTILAFSKVMMRENQERIRSENKSQFVNLVQKQYTGISAILCLLLTENCQNILKEKAFVSYEQDEEFGSLGPLSITTIKNTIFKMNIFILFFLKMSRFYSIYFPTNIICKFKIYFGGACRYIYMCIYCT